MSRIWLSIGSNIEREQHITEALLQLESELGEAILSPFYESPAEGFDGPDFINLVAGYDTEKNPAELIRLFNSIESGLGRTRTEKKFSSRTIDIDLLTYGDRVIEVMGKQLPRDDILKYSFVLKPLSDVAPDEVHVLTGKSYRQHWDEFTPKDQLILIDSSD
jgi:2-amino-4-hydroxy-6-hydroxymethyldihydropteridine diphosphokinase